MKRKATPPKLFIGSNRPLVPITMRSIVTRKGALDVLNKPSRIGNSLFHTDGTIEKSPTTETV